MTRRDNPTCAEYLAQAVDLVFDLLRGAFPHQFLRIDAPDEDNVLFEILCQRDGIHAARLRLQGVQRVDTRLDEQRDYLEDGAARV